MAMNDQTPTTSNYHRPWEVVDSEELKLLRRLEKVVSDQGGVTTQVHSILSQLSELREKTRG